MSNPVKEKIAANLDKVKGEGKVRAENIREIVKDAVIQAVDELKEGGSEIGLIIKDAIATVIADLKGSTKQTTETIADSIVGAIEGSTYQKQQAIAKQRAKLLEIEALLDKQQQDLDAEIGGALVDIKAIEAADSTDVNSDAINSAVNAVQDRQESGMLKDQYLKLKTKMASLDKHLEFRYGDRYGEVKEKWEDVKVWYEQKKTEAETTGTIPLHQKQAEIESNIDDFGSVVARKEKEVKQQLKKLWQDKGFGT
jgi:hypothetical protein